MSAVSGVTGARPSRAERWLVVTRAGPDSLHGQWQDGAEPARFDLLVSAFDPRAPRPAQGDLFELRPGSKVAGYAALFRDRPELLRQYDRIALLDDDLATDAAQLNRMFDLCARHDLTLAQPALSHDSHFTYAGLLAQPAFTLRYVTYIEMMCPIFRTDALARALPLFDLGYESGIDLIWCNLFDAPEQRFAILDACPVRHTKPVGDAKALNGFTDGRRYEDDIGQILRQFDLPWLPCVPYGAADRAGRMVSARTASGKWRLRRAALATLGALPGPYPRARLRKILVHWKHLWRATPQNILRQLPDPAAVQAARQQPASAGDTSPVAGSDSRLHPDQLAPPVTRDIVA